MRRNVSRGLAPVEVCACGVPVRQHKVYHPVCWEPADPEWDAVVEVVADQLGHDQADGERPADDQADGKRLG